MKPDDVLTGRLIIATPALEDPNFERTVVLILEHDVENGALGVVLNRPSHLAVEEALPGWERLAGDPAVVHIGGPVEPRAVIALGQAWEHDVAGWTPLIGGIGVVNAGMEVEDLVFTVHDVRVFAGYSGWGVGQLEAEIDAGAWFVVDATPEDPLRPDVERLWRDALARQPGRLRMFANFPDDPRTN